MHYSCYTHGGPLSRALPRTVQINHTVWTNYAGYYYSTSSVTDGTEFDNSFARPDNCGHPLMFIVGIGQVIKGWDETLMLMNEGERALLVIPPALAYGAKPPKGMMVNATLVFYVEMVKITTDPPGNMTSGCPSMSGK